MYRMPYRRVEVTPVLKFPQCRTMKSQLEKKRVTGKRGGDKKCDNTEYYQQETACWKDKRCLVILAVMFYLLLACHG